MTPKTSISRLQIGYSILLLLFPFLAMAQEIFPDNTDDVTPAAPIDDYAPLALLLGIYFAYRFLQNKMKQLNN
jgi:hypothetical protein